MTAVPGLSDNIRVRSIVGRYLEHPRIFRFGEREEARHYIGSADLMQRNVDQRVEAMAPVSECRSSPTPVALSWRAHRSSW